MVPGQPERRPFSTPADVLVLSDAELARRIAGAAVDGEAEAELCRRFAPRIRLYGIRHLRNEARVEDLVQSVLLAVLETIRQGRLDDPELLPRFVLGTARNLALKAHRADTRAKPVEASEFEDMPALPEPDRLDSTALARCFGSLDGRARAVVYMSFARDKRSEEIARALETTAGNVRVVRHRALAQLRSCLDGGAVNA